MPLRLAVRNAATGYWHDCPGGPLHLGERARVRIDVLPEAPAQGVRVLVGDVLVASSHWEDRAEYHLRPIGYPPSEWTCLGKIFRDWIGETEIRAETLEGGHWKPLAQLGPVYVEPERLKPEEFAALCDAVAAQSADLLADVYGKTSLGQARGGGAATGPAAVLVRMRQVLDQLAAALNEVARSPAYRLKSRRTREPALPGQSVSELTLEEACIDPGLAVVVGGVVRFREQVREVASLNFRLAENQLIADFLAFLRQQLGDVRTNLAAEIHWREAQRPFRDRPGPPGTLSWWESEDKPRIVECERLLRQTDGLEGEVNRLSRLSFLPPGQPLTAMPPSTPLVRSHRAYGSAYRVAAEHFAGYRLRVDAGHLVTRARSLPVLYEWWCALEMLRILRGCLQPAGDPKVGRRLESDQGRYVVEFTADQSIEFADEAGRRVRFRYQPAYRPPGEDRELGLLGRGAVRTPDMSLEIYPASGSTTPELIIVLDAKYSSAPHPVKLDAVKLKYDRIGEFRTGRVLTRQVWAMVPTPPGRSPLRAPEWAMACSVDNVGVFSDEFDVDSCVVGVIHAVPLTGPGKSPVEGLLRHLFSRMGLALTGMSGEPFSAAPVTSAPPPPGR